MEPNLFKYILKHSRAEQLAILGVVAVSLLFYYASLDLPKTIVNAITKLSAHADRTSTFMHLELGLPGFLGGSAIVLFDGFRLERTAYLVAICTLFLIFVVINNWFKVYINTAKGKMRQLAARALAGRIAECADGSVEIHVHDTSNYERADIVERLARIYAIRFELYQRKFAVKGLNNFLAQVTPFTFYLLGGLLAFAGKVDLGIIVAVINAYKDLPGPVKELIDWDQQRQDVQIKYEQVVEQFEPEGSLPEALQAMTAEPPEPLTGEIAFTGVVALDDNGSKLLDGLSVALATGDQVALLGDGTSGNETVATALVRLTPLAAGSITLAGRPLAELPESFTGRNIGYAGPEAYLFPISVRD